MLLPEAANCGVKRSGAGFRFQQISRRRLS